jgi:hypothetical protein
VSGVARELQAFLTLKAILHSTAASCSAREYPMSLADILRSKSKLCPHDRPRVASDLHGLINTQDGLPREQAQLVDQLSTVTSYVQLQAWLSQHQATTESQQEKSGLDAEAAVLAFVRAAELAPSLQFVALEDGEPEVRY